MKSLVGIGIKKYLDESYIKGAVRLDVLKEVYQGTISAVDAKSLYKELFQKYHKNELKIHAEDYLCFSIFERTAIILHGIQFDAVAKWRYEGWPTECVVCKEPLNVLKGNWGALPKLKMHSKVYSNVLIHWDCNEKIPRKR